MAGFQATGTQADFDSLQNGTAIIRTDRQANAYLAAYGDMHRMKLDSAFEALFRHLTLTTPVDVFDWGCGQGLATGVLLDFSRQHGLALPIRQISLIEPSLFAMTRAIEHLHVLGVKADVRTFNQTAESISPVMVKSSGRTIKLHLFSNLLDMLTVDYRAIAQTIRQSQPGQNLFVCVSPLTGSPTRNAQLERFRNEFADHLLISARTDSLAGLMFGIRAMRPMVRTVKRNESVFSVQL